MSITIVLSDRFYTILIQLTDTVMFIGSHRISMPYYTARRRYTHYNTYLYTHSVIYVTHSLLHTWPVNTIYTYLHTTYIH